MLDRVLGLASAASLVVGTAISPAGPDAEVELTFRDPEIVESSGLVATGAGLFVTTNDSGDRGRVFVVDRTGATVGATSWSPMPRDVEALAPAGPGAVWVGDIGDNPRSRESIAVLRVPVGRGERVAEPATYELVYPDGAHDAETLLAEPRTGQLFVISKDIFGGVIYAAPRRLSTEGPNRLRAVAHSFSFATDGSFFPDGRHYVVRGYASATVYSFPAHEAVGSFPLPAQRQGEGISVGADGELYLSTEGQYADVLRMPVPPRVARAMTAPAGAPSPSPSPSSAAARPVDLTAEPGRDGPWTWLALACVAVVFAAGGGWLLIRRGQAP